MKYLVKLTPSAKKELDKIPGEYKNKVLNALFWLEKDPFAGKKLHGKFKNYYSWKVWPYRIIYRIFKNELLIFVVAIGHRQGIYKRGI
ncbi:MAG: type II toxin-antitoxin system RelE/ParE family toxin [Candidatus Gracilibacteria bacterium]|jgi:mRNA interferase RelE/StbE